MVNFVVVLVFVIVVCVIVVLECVVCKEEFNRNMFIFKMFIVFLGKFDNKIEGELKVRGMKWKFDVNIFGGSEGMEKER